MRFVAIQTLLNFAMMKVNSGHHSGHPNRNIRYYDSEGSDDDIGEGGEPILGELSYEKFATNWFAIFSFIIIIPFAVIVTDVEIRVGIISV